MVASSLRTLAILTVIAGTLICSSDVVSADKCGADLFHLAMHCFEFVLGNGPNKPPSASCCAEVTKIDVKCACNVIKEDIAELVNVTKAVFVGRSCGLNLPAGTQCGAITLPSARR